MVSTFKRIREYDGTVARIAGNIAAGIVADPHVGVDASDEEIAAYAVFAVALARRIVDEVKRTEPKEPA